MLIGRDSSLFRDDFGLGKLVRPGSYALCKYKLLRNYANTQV